LIKISQSESNETDVDKDSFEKSFETQRDFFWALPVAPNQAIEKNAMQH
jgi:hypothetical protein